MMQEDSNGESTFEFVDKKEELSHSDENLPNTDSLSSLSSSTSIVPLSAVSSSGNLLSNVAPPSALPSFISPSEGVPSSTPEVITNPPVSLTTILPPHAFHPTTFSPVIPASKGTGELTPVAMHDNASDAGGKGLLGWVKGAVGTSSGLLSRVAEKAKNSVDSMITTLDPQMREFLHSGGDIDVVVASDKEIKVSPVREAFQLVFGKATVTGKAAQASSIAAQPVGFHAGVKAAEERISMIRIAAKLHPDQPVLAVENFIVEVGEDKWYDLGVLLLEDPARELKLETFTQLTPVPAAIVTLARDDTPSDYPLAETGLAITVGSLLANNLQVHHSEWHEALTGVSRREMLLLAAKTLAGLYKTSISNML